MKVSRALIACSVLSALAVACSDDSLKYSMEDAQRKLGETICPRVKSCFPDSFVQAYKDEQECIDKTVAVIPANRRQNESVCSRREIDTCMDDIRNAQCSVLFANGTLAYPASCVKCMD